MKKDNDQYYFDVLKRCAALGLDAARLLQNTLRDFHPETLQKQMEAMHVIEHEADDVKHKMMEKLSHEFMTPIEREDILALSHELDNVVDSIDDVLQRIYMYNVRSMRPDVCDFTALIVRSCAELNAAMEDFALFRKRGREVAAHVVSVNTLESDGDALFIQAMHRLYGSETNPIAVAAWDHLYDCMEQCLDACEHVSDAIESVVMKNT